jgi:hypothetical protein
MNNFSKVWQNENVLIYAKMVKALRYTGGRDFWLCFVMQAKAHYTCQLKVDEV